MHIQYGGGNCRLCGSPSTNMSNCPLNPNALKPNPSRHPNAVPTSAQSTPTSRSRGPSPTMPQKPMASPKWLESLKILFPDPQSIKFIEVATVKGTFTSPFTQQHISEWLLDLPVLNRESSRQLAQSMAHLHPDTRGIAELAAGCLLMKRYGVAPRLVSKEVLHVALLRVFPNVEDVKYVEEVLMTGKCNCPHSDDELIGWFKKLSSRLSGRVSQFMALLHPTEVPIAMKAIGLLLIEQYGPKSPSRSVEPPARDLVVYGVQRRVSWGKGASNLEGWTLCYLSPDQDVAVAAARLINGPLEGLSERVETVRVVEFQQEEEYSLSSSPTVIFQRETSDERTVYSAFDRLPANPDREQPSYIVIATTRAGHDVLLLVTTSISRATALARESPNNHIYSNKSAFHKPSFEGCVNDWEVLGGGPTP
jgi:hypothetical protein